MFVCVLVIEVEISGYLVSILCKVGGVLFESDVILVLDCIDQVLMLLRCFIVVWFVVFILLSYCIRWLVVVLLECSFFVLFMVRGVKIIFLLLLVVICVVVIVVFICFL